MNIKKIIKKIPVFDSLAFQVYSKWIKPPSLFAGSESYWESRYKTGGNSGAGSYNELADFKAEVLNRFVRENNIISVIEYGCGDGNQLSLVKYPKYLGFDVSSRAMFICQKKFANDQTKTFKLVENYNGETAELTMSLDVIYHLIEEKVFINYMTRLFDSSQKFVIIYSSNTDLNPESTPAHIKHRKFSEWIATNKLSWELISYIPNKYPLDVSNQTGSFADFYIYKNNKGL